MKNVRLAFFNFFAFVAVGGMISQLIVLIGDAGYTPLQKSLILGCGALLSFVLSVWLGQKSDRLGKLKPSFYISMSIYLGCMWGCLLVNSLWKAVAFVGVIGASRTVMSSCETMVLVAKKEDFSKYHSMGALGLICGSLLVGSFSLFQKILLCCFSAALSVICIFAWQEAQGEKKELHWRDVKKLISNRTYLGFLFLFFFLMLMGFADQYIVVEKMVQLQATPQLISIKYALQACMEIPIYLCMKRLLEKVDTAYLLLFTIIMSAVKFILYGAAPTATLIVWASLLQITTHPLIVVLSKKLIASCTPASLMASSQLIGFAVYFGISGFLTSLLGQGLSLVISYDMTLYLFASFAIFPFFIWCKMKKYCTIKNGDENENIFN